MHIRFCGLARAQAIAAKNPAAPPPTIAICTRHRDCRCANLQRDSKILDRKNAPKQPALMNSLNRFADPVYCLMRLIVGLMLACHGAQLALGLFGGMPGSDKMITQIGGWIQLVGGFMIAFGLLTRLAAFICSGM